jgi:hypothetical protein
MKLSNKEISNAPIALISIFSHLYAFIVFGAVFWIDSKAYVSLGYALAKTNGLNEFYNGIGTWFYSHVQPGLPLVWLAIDGLPIGWHWPTMAIFQHTLAATSLFYFFSTINFFWPSRWNYVGCFIVGFLPFYQAAHNSLMTESISSSLFLFGFSLVMRVRAGATLSYKKALLLAFVILSITQFRSYFGIFIFAIYLLPFRNFNNPDFRTSLILSLALVISILLFPFYRYLETGEFFLPSLGMNKLQTGWWSNPIPSRDVLRKLEDFDFPENFSPASRINKGLDYNEAAAIALHWRKNGLTDIEINNRASEAGSILANDSVQVFSNRILLALTSSGFTNAYCLINKQIIVFPGYSARKLCAHIKNVYKFHSWLSAVNQHSLFDEFFGEKLTDELFKHPFDTISSRFIHEDSEEYLSEFSLRRRDPLRLGKIAPDWIILISVLTMIITTSDRRFFALMCLFVMAGNAAVNFLAPLGNPRYGYFLFPLFIGFAFTGVPQVYCWLRSRWS